MSTFKQPHKVFTGSQRQRERERAVFFAPRKSGQEVEIIKVRPFLFKCGGRQVDTAKDQSGSFSCQERGDETFRFPSDSTSLTYICDVK